MSMQLERSRTFRTEPPARNRRSRIALDGNQLPILVVDELSTAHTTIGAYRLRGLRAVRFRMQVYTSIRHGLDAGSIRTGSNLADQWPLSKQFADFHRLDPKIAGNSRWTRAHMIPNHERFAWRSRRLLELPK